MIYIVYRLNFSDGTKYVGQTCNLNSRIASHKALWSKDFSIKIDSVDIAKFCNSQKEALAVESSLIEFYGIENLRNSQISSMQRIEEEEIAFMADKLDAEEEPSRPIDVIFTADMLDTLESREKYLSKKVSQLENRYITTYLRLEAMKNNIKHLDIIIDEAIMKAIR